MQIAKFSRQHDFFSLWVRGVFVLGSTGSSFLTASQCCDWKDWKLTPVPTFISAGYVEPSHTGSPQHSSKYLNTMGDRKPKSI